MVSIHALLAECDRNWNWWRTAFTSFNPRTPCGVRQDAAALTEQEQKVSIHALLAECDTGLYRGIRSGQVSIHALLAECDLFRNGRFITTTSFNPRTPCGVRLYRKQLLNLFQSVSIHALLAECDSPGPACQGSLTGFNPRTPCGVRLLQRGC